MHCCFSGALIFFILKCVSRDPGQDVIMAGALVLDELLALLALAISGLSPGQQEHSQVSQDSGC